MAFRIFLAFYDANIATLPGGALDSFRFHNKAVAIANGDLGFDFIMGPEFYDSILGAVYKIASPEKFVGNMIGVALSVLAMMFFVKHIDFHGLHHGSALFFFLFAFDPTFLLYGSLTLREAFELLCLMIAVFYLFCLIESKSKRSVLCYCILIAVSLVILAFLHRKAMILFSLLMFFGIAFLYCCLNRSWGLKVIVIATCTVAALVIWICGGEGMIKYAFVDDGSISAGRIEKYRQVILSYGPRTPYPFDLDTSSVLGFLWTGYLVMAQYMFYPLLINTSDVKDLVPIAGSVQRVILVLYILFSLRTRKFPREQLFYIWLIIGICMLVSAIWAAGSSNYGQGFRHLIMTNWMLILCAALVYNCKARSLAQ